MFDGDTALVDSGVLPPLPAIVHANVTVVDDFPSYRTSNSISRRLTWRIIVGVRWTGNISRLSGFSRM